MHIIIGVLTAIGTILWALYRLQDAGVNLNSFNPFYWVRRRKWEKKLGTKAMHQIENPMEAAALLVVGVASTEGDLTRELKTETIELFKSEFGINTSKANEFYSASSYMLKEASNMSAEVRNILFPTKSQFESHHIESLLKMLNAVAKSEGDPSEEQLNIIKAVESEFANEAKQETKW